jgi:hypothetical protein
MENEALIILNRLRLYPEVKQLAEDIILDDLIQRPDASPPYDQLIRTFEDKEKVQQAMARWEKKPLAPPTAAEEFFNAKAQELHELWERRDAKQLHYGADNSEVYFTFDSDDPYRETANDGEYKIQVKKDAKFKRDEVLKMRDDYLDMMRTPFRDLSVPKLKALIGDDDDDDRIEEAYQMMDDFFGNKQNKQLKALAFYYIDKYHQIIARTVSDTFENGHGICLSVKLNYLRLKWYTEVAFYWFAEGKAPHSREDALKQMEALVRQRPANKCKEHGDFYLSNDQWRRHRDELFLTGVKKYFERDSHHDVGSCLHDIHLLKNMAAAELESSSMQISIFGTKIDVGMDYKTYSYVAIVPPSGRQEADTISQFLPMVRKSEITLPIEVENLDAPRFENENSVIPIVVDISNGKRRDININVLVSSRFSLQWNTLSLPGARLSYPHQLIGPWCVQLVYLRSEDRNIRVLGIYIYEMMHATRLYAELYPTLQQSMNRLLRHDEEKKQGEIEKEFLHKVGVKPVQRDIDRIKCYSFLYFEMPFTRASTLLHCSSIALIENWKAMIRERLSRVEGGDNDIAIKTLRDMLRELDAAPVREEDAVIPMETSSPRLREEEEEDAVVISMETTSPRLREEEVEAMETSPRVDEKEAPIAQSPPQRREEDVIPMETSPRLLREEEVQSPRREESSSRRAREEEEEDEEEEPRKKIMSPEDMEDKALAQFAHVECYEVWEDRNDRQTKKFSSVRHARNDMWSEKVDYDYKMTKREGIENVGDGGVYLRDQWLDVLRTRVDDLNAAQIKKFFPRDHNVAWNDEAQNMKKDIVKNQLTPALLFVYLKNMLEKIQARFEEVFVDSTYMNAHLEYLFHKWFKETGIHFFKNGRAPKVETQLQLQEGDFYLNRNAWRASQIETRNAKALENYSSPHQQYEREGISRAKAQWLNDQVGADLRDIAQLKAMTIPPPPTLKISFNNMTFDLQQYHMTHTCVAIVPTGEAGIEDIVDFFPSRRKALPLHVIESNGMDRVQDISRNGAYWDSHLFRIGVSSSGKEVDISLDDGDAVFLKQNALSRPRACFSDGYHINGTSLCVQILYQPDENPRVGGDFRMRLLGVFIYEIEPFDQRDEMQRLVQNRMEQALLQLEQEQYDPFLDAGQQLVDDNPKKTVKAIIGEKIKELNGKIKEAQKKYNDEKKKSDKFLESIPEAAMATLTRRLNKHYGGMLKSYWLKKDDIDDARRHAAEREVDYIDGKLRDFERKKDALEKEIESLKLLENVNMSAVAFYRTLLSKKATSDILQQYKLLVQELRLVRPSPILEEILLHFSSSSSPQLLTNIECCAFVGYQMPFTQASTLLLCSQPYVERWKVALQNMLARAQPLIQQWKALSPARFGFETKNSVLVILENIVNELTVRPALKEKEEDERPPREAEPEPMEISPRPEKKKFDIKTFFTSFSRDCYRRWEKADKLQSEEGFFWHPLSHPLKQDGDIFTLDVVKSKASWRDWSEEEKKKRVSQEVIDQERQDRKDRLKSFLKERDEWLDVLRSSTEIHHSELQKMMPKEWIAEAKQIKGDFEGSKITSALLYVYLRRKFFRLLEDCDDTFEEKAVTCLKAHLRYLFTAWIISFRYSFKSSAKVEIYPGIVGEASELRHWDFEAEIGKVAWFEEYFTCTNDKEASYFYFSRDKWLEERRAQFIATSDKSFDAFIKSESTTQLVSADTMIFTMVSHDVKKRYVEFFENANLRIAKCLNYMHQLNEQRNNSRVNVNNMKLSVQVNGGFELTFNLERMNDYSCIAIVPREDKQVEDLVAFLPVQNSNKLLTIAQPNMDTQTFLHEKITVEVEIGGNFRKTVPVAMSLNSQLGETFLHVNALSRPRACFSRGYYLYGQWCVQLLYQLSEGHDKVSLLGIFVYKLLQGDMYEKRMPRLQQILHATFEEMERTYYYDPFSSFGANGALLPWDERNIRDILRAQQDEERQKLTEHMEKHDQHMRDCMEFVSAGVYALKTVDAIKRRLETLKIVDRDDNAWENVNRKLDVAQRIAIQMVEKHMELRAIRVEEEKAKYVEKISELDDLDFPVDDAKQLYAELCVRVRNSESNVADLTRWYKLLARAVGEEMIFSSTLEQALKLREHVGALKPPELNRIRCYALIGYHAPFTRASTLLLCPEPYIEKWKRYIGGFANLQNSGKLKVRDSDTISKVLLNMAKELNLLE